VQFLLSLLAIARFIAFGILLIPCIPIQAVVIALGLRIRNTLPIYFHRFLTNVIVGIKVETAGTMRTTPPTLFLSNHLSYLDAISLASVIPTHFVAKTEVAKWPLFGYLTKLQGTLFVDRNNKKGASKQGEAMAAILNDKINIVLFPEGTSTNGSEVKMFKGGMLQAVLNMADKDVMIQPISIACYGKNGIQHRYAWYGDMTLMPHLWAAFKTVGLTVRITFHEPFNPAQFTDRKEMADYARNQVAKGPFGPFDTDAIKALPTSV
jgi:lyso-ornithine lipid O-acyltransferase